MCNLWVSIGNMNLWLGVKVRKSYAANHNQNVSMSNVMREAQMT